MSGEFAKLFGEGESQILTIIQSNDQGEPEVRVFFQVRGFGVSSAALSFNDNDAGWDKAGRIFANTDESVARAFVDKALEHTGIKQMIEGGA